MKLCMASTYGTVGLLLTLTGIPMACASEEEALHLDVVESTEELPGVNDADVETEECEIVIVSPSLGEWTPWFDSDNPPADCVCSSTEHAFGGGCLYQGRIDSISGNLAAMSFRKTDQSAMSTNSGYWLAVSAEPPSCHVRDIAATRTEGRWLAGEAKLTLQEVPIWPTTPPEETYENASDGARKTFFLITGGAGYTEERIWFQAQELIFEKQCQ